MSEISNNSNISNNQSKTIKKNPEILNNHLNSANSSLKLPESKIDSNKKRVASTIVDETKKANHDTKAFFGGRSFGASSQKINPDLMQNHTRNS